MQFKSAAKTVFHNYGELRNYGNIPKKGPMRDFTAKELIHGYQTCVNYVGAQIGLLLDELLFKIQGTI